MRKPLAGSRLCLKWRLPCSLPSDCNRLLVSLLVDCSFYTSTLILWAISPPRISCSNCQFAHQAILFLTPTQQTHPATLPSSSHPLNPHKHLLSPESSPERDLKHTKLSEPQIHQVNSAPKIMSSEEDYDDLVYDDDEGFDQDDMDPGKFSVA